jgi:hypothetical protein
MGSRLRRFLTQTTDKKAMESARMPTARSLGFNIKYQQVGSSGSGDDEQRKVAVICGWMGAKERQLKVYQQFYQERGFDTLSFACGPQHVLRPHHAMKVMESVVDELIKVQPEKVVFHHFSMGGYLFGQMLRHFKANDNKRQAIVPKIIAQVFDSPPDFRSIAKGVSQSMGVKDGTVAKAVELMMRFYLFVSSTTAGVEHRAASANFHRNAVTAPSLWFYSRSDPVALHEDCETVISKWREQGTHVKEVVWDDTPHIQHARVDPTTYFGALDSFLETHGKETVEKESENEQQWSVYQESTGTKASQSA